ncbi:MAG: phospholipase [Planctomycetes bacterium]|nr:phospholipase [Planctomycetota bacterium]
MNGTEGSPLHGLSNAALVGLARALEAAQLAAPITSLSIAPWVPAGPLREATADEFQRLLAAGMQPSHLAYALRLLCTERVATERAQGRVELVWTGPEPDGAANRDTRVVVDDLFRAARRRVVVSTFVVYQGRDLFRTLAQRMDEVPDLRASIFVNVPRREGDPRSEAEILREFADNFRGSEWSGKRLPEVYYDPRALDVTPGPRACLHAKCVVVDDERAFITSANFTEAAQVRNVEVGLLVADAFLARALTRQFDDLVADGSFRGVPGLGAGG